MKTRLFGCDYPLIDFSRTGLNSSVALVSSAFGSAPLIMLVRATPKMSRNSVTGMISGKPGRPTFVLATRVSNHSFGTVRFFVASGLV